MVYKIIVNYVYTGATVGHRRKSGGVGSRKSIAQDQEDWIVVEGMHEAIVSKDEFELAQAVIRGGNPLRQPPEVLDAMLRNDEGVQFGHTMEEELGGQLAAGFVLTALYEDRDRPGGAEIGRFLPQYMATLARKASV